MNDPQRLFYTNIFDQGVREVHEASDGEANTYDYIKGGLLELVDNGLIKNVLHSRDLSYNAEVRGYFDSLVDMLVSVADEYEGYGNEWTLSETLIDTLYHNNSLKETK